ncbi:MAG: ROK family transcriptional regulator [Lachnospiraceae bacterium]|nr:ROK family transcriptional regulator [Lachnospiraceae bacterium]
MVTGSKELIRDINSTLVLECVLKNEKISRADIAKELGLTKATVSTIAYDLIDKGFLKEVGNANTTAGRKPILLQFDAAAGYIISIDLGVEEISCAISDLLGGGIKILQKKTPKKGKDIYKALCTLIDEQIKSAPKCPHGLAGIAIGVHGAVKDNKVTFAPYYDIKDIDFAGDLNEKYGAKVVIENEANLSALGEGTFTYDYPLLANISVHTGLGLGILDGNRIYEGAGGGAGEIGHTIVEIDGRECPCGNHGCLEQYVSERVLFSQYAAKKGKDSITSDEFFEDYIAKDKDAIATVETFTKYMAVCVNNVLNAFNPDVVVINSTFVANIPSLIEKIEKRLSCKICKYDKIVSSSLQDASILLGGVCLATCAHAGVSKLK